MKKSKQDCDLNSCFLCRNVAKEWLPLLALKKQTFRVGRGKELFKEGDPVQGIYFLEHGRMKVHQQWTEDKELILRFAAAGTIVGHRGLGEDLYYPVSATALEDCSVCFVDLEFFYATLKVNPGMLLQLMLFFAEELRESELRMRNMARHTVKNRLAGALIYLAKKFGTTTEGWLDLPLSRQDLAAYVGAAYETVFRMLQELAEEQLIKISGKDIAIINLDKLSRIALQEEDS